MYKFICVCKLFILPLQKFILHKFYKKFMDENQARNRRLGEVLDQLKKRGINNKQVANAIGIDGSLFSNIKNENEPNNLTKEVAELICNKIITPNNEKVSFNWLFDGQGEMFYQISDSQTFKDEQKPGELAFKPDIYEEKSPLKNVSEMQSNINKVQNSEKNTSEQIKIAEKIMEVEKTTEKPIEKKIVRITVFYEDGTYRELYK